MSDNDARWRVGTVSRDDRGTREEDWLFDLEAIHAAARDLGIEWPIVLKFSQGGKDGFGVLGSYRTKHCICHGTPYHSISVGALISDPDDTIRHELAHAVQAERGDDMRGGKNSPSEVEAREVEGQHAGEALTKVVMVGVGIVDGEWINIPSSCTDAFFAAGGIERLREMEVAA